ncbi:hypothetical protein T10_6336 [Trichinella papuae]|uniref:Uncharacterized protein n=1 Tax=Trichinella papuae TaxID=268474 RepID=A0A0V1MZY8_9BILA|nr:hypothetical protein T10_6336 [Trichinella papuae]
MSELPFDGGCFSSGFKHNQPICVLQHFRSPGQSESHLHLSTESPARVRSLYPVLTSLLNAYLLISRLKSYANGYFIIFQLEHCHFHSTCTEPAIPYTRYSFLIIDKFQKYVEKLLDANNTTPSR